MLPLEWATDIDRARLGVSEIVSGVLTSGGMSMVYGDSNSGKTYMGRDVAGRNERVSFPHEPRVVAWVGCSDETDPHHETFVTVKMAVTAGATETT